MNPPLATTTDTRRSIKYYSSSLVSLSLTLRMVLGGTITAPTEASQWQLSWKRLHSATPNGPSPRLSHGFIRKKQKWLLQHKTHWLDTGAKKSFIFFFFHSAALALLSPFLPIFLSFSHTYSSVSLCTRAPL